MIYDKNIPDYALQPARDPEVSDDGFDPSPYDRILNAKSTDREMFEFASEANFPEIEIEAADTEIAVPLEERYEPVFASEGASQEPFVEAEAEAEEDETPVMEAAEETEWFAGEQILAEPAAAEPFVTEPAVVEPVVAPIPVPVKKEPAKIIPLAGSVVYSGLKITDIKEPPKTRIFIEEDILVPDIKPDLLSILTMDGVAKLSDKEIQVGANGEDTLKVSGEIALQTIYMPDKAENGQEQIITIQSRLPFKTDWGVSVSPLSHVAIKPIIENVDYTVINERKFRAKIAMLLTLQEYREMDLEIFEGIRGEDVQLLKEKILLTDVAVRKTDVVELNEDLALKDSAPVPEKILKYNINIVENHKQIAGEKAVINAMVYCNVLYLADQAWDDAANGEEDLVDVAETGGRHRKEPCLFQGKTEFTQFIPFAGIENPAGSRISFNGNDLTLKIQEEEGLAPAFHLEGSIETSLELYKNVEREIVKDLYHNNKDISYDYSEVGAMTLAGSGVTEVSMREILNVPERYGEVDKVIYITGRVKNSEGVIEQGKNVIEGAAEITLLCLGADERHTPFKITQEVPFRGAMEIPGVKQGMVSDNDISIKDLWFDKLNGRQIEVNAGVLISSSVSNQESHKLIKNVCFVERAESSERLPSMIVYISRKGDNLWKIAKNYRTTVDTIKAINNLDGGGQIAPGTKLLIVK